MFVKFMTLVVIVTAIYQLYDFCVIFGIIKKKKRGVKCQQKDG